ncbi:MAG: peptidoglycan-binding protein [Frankia sp.]
MGKHRSNRLSRKHGAVAAVGLATTVAGTLLAAAGPASAAISSQFIISQPHSVQRACAVRILAAQGPGAWSAWGGSLDNMMAESGDNDKAINASSGAAGYYQIMPSTWAALCSDLGTGSAAVTPAAPVATTHASTVATPAHAVTTSSSASHSVASTSVAATHRQYGHSYSSHVQAVQRLLERKGYSVGPEGADGILGRHTYAGICRFQRAHNLVVDGIPGAHTWAALTS